MQMIHLMSHANEKFPNLLSQTPIIDNETFSNYYKEDLFYAASLAFERVQLNKKDNITYNKLIELWERYLRQRLDDKLKIGKYVGTHYLFIKEVLHHVNNYSFTWIFNEWNKDSIIKAFRSKDMDFLKENCNEIANWDLEYLKHLEEHESYLVAYV